VRFRGERALGYTRARHEAAPANDRGEGPWPLFWEIEGLRRATLDEEVATGTFTGFGRRHPLQKQFHSRRGRFSLNIQHDGDV